MNFTCICPYLYLRTTEPWRIFTIFISPGYVGVPDHRRVQLRSFGSVVDIFDCESNRELMRVPLRAEKINSPPTEISATGALVAGTSGARSPAYTSIGAGAPDTASILNPTVATLSAMFTRTNCESSTASMVVPG